MTIELSSEARKQSIASIERYFSMNMDEEIELLGADALLDYILIEIGPVIYNKAVADVQINFQARVMEIDAEVYEDEFQYWNRLESKSRNSVRRKSQG